ncbi:MAG: hypothetical protein ABW034_06350 [Steroidobacteraceae bacterium]
MPNTFQIFFDRFNPSPAADQWQPALGQWVRKGGIYSSTTVAPTSVTTVTSYATVDPGLPDSSVVDDEQPIEIQARMLNRGATDNALVGLAFNYQDAQNFYELVFSPTGRSLLRRINGGAVQPIASAGYTGGGQDRWFDVVLQRREGRTTVQVNGNEIFTTVPQDALASGRIGLVTHRSGGRFDNVRVNTPQFAQPFKERFDDGIANGWQPISGAWSVSNQQYATGVQQTSLSLAPADVKPGEVEEFGFRAKLFNPYGASGNRIGLVWNDGENEVVFTPTGEAILNRITANGVIPLGSAPIPLLQKQWFEVQLDVCRNCRPFSNDPWIGTIRLNGQVLFDDLEGERFFPQGRPLGKVGLVTHWTPGRFDNVEFRVRPFPQSYSQNFSSRPPEAMVRTGRWEPMNGTYDSLAVQQDAITTFPIGDEGVDFLYRARLLNRYGASGNLVGLVTNFNEEHDYYEVVFSQTGKAYANKVVNGTKVQLAVANHSVPPNTWFTVELRHVGTRTQVRLNDAILFADLPQGQIRGGFAGLVTHWSLARFDDLRWEELKQ